MRIGHVWGGLLLLALACSNGSSGGGGSGGGVAPQGASRAALESAVDGADPWGVLGPQSGSFSAQLTALENDCSFGPEAPFPSYYPGDPFQVYASTYAGTLEQRGDDVVLELGEGLLFARVEGSRWVDVVRVGAEGVTHYHDALDVTAAPTGFLVSGESDWTFEGDYWQAETCEGRTAFSLELRGDAPGGSPQDLQFVLRWPVNSGADLDLLVERGFPDRDQRVYLGHVFSGCHVLHSAGTAGAAGDSQVVPWIHPLADTDLPYHEEIVRCADASYGTWHLDVVNWNGDEPADFEIEVFEGPTIGVRRSEERALGMLEQAAEPHSLTPLIFNYVPPPGGAGAGITIIGITRPRAERPDDPLSGSALGFNKAAALDVSYEEFLANVGLD